MNGDLNAKQLAFVLAFMELNEATSAAKQAGYSAKSAQVIGCQLLKHPKIAAEIARRRKPIEKKSALSAEKIFDALNNLVDFDIAQCYDEAGNLLAVNKMPLEARKALTSIDLSKPGGHIKSTSRLGAIELAAKLLGMVREQQSQQQAVQIIIAAPAAQLEVSVERKQLLPEWE
jgi:phage terminase small subunit